MNGGFNLYVCANAGPVYGCRTPGDPCVDNAAGLANLLYPPVDGDSMRPVSSVRWELLSIGLQVRPCRDIHESTYCPLTVHLLCHSLTSHFSLASSCCPQDAEYFTALDRLTDQLLSGGRVTDSGNNRDCSGAGGENGSSSGRLTTAAEAATVALCCGVVGAARAALDRVGEVVWDFPSSSNLTSAPYSDDVALMHSVLDGVLYEIEHVKAVLVSGACSV